MPKLSIVVPTIKPEKWLKFCHGLLNINFDFEVIFVSPYMNILQLPIPVKFIYSNAFPCKSWEQGARVATGDFLCLTCDDFFYSNGFFKDAINILKTCKNKFDNITARFTDDEGEKVYLQSMLGEISMPLISMVGVYFTEGYHQIGGIDKRFLGCEWDIDLSMRLHEAGGRCILLPGHTIHENSGVPQPDSSHHPTHSKFGHWDRPLLHQLWFDNNKPRLTRSCPVQSFSVEEAGIIQYKSTKV